MTDQQNPDERAALDKLRNRIDALDEQIGELISARANCAMEVAAVKSAKADPTSAAPKFYRPEREAQVLRKAGGLFRS